MSIAILKISLPPPRKLTWFDGRTAHEVRSAQRPRPAWGDVLWPPPDRRLAIVATWYCWPELIEEAAEFRPRRVIGAYCGARPGFRCRCGAQLHGHDPGGEDGMP